jgi:hypothetical protein
MKLTYEEIDAAVMSGDFDADLEKLSKLIENRISTKRSSRSINDYGIGDRVRLNSMCGTKYLQGHTAVVTGKGRTKLIVKLESPTGRFLRFENGVKTSVDIKVPLMIIDPVA